MSGSYGRDIDLMSGSYYITEVGSSNCTLNITLFSTNNFSLALQRAVSAVSL